MSSWTSTRTRTDLQVSILLALKPGGAGPTTWLAPGLQSHSTFLWPTCTTDRNVSKRTLLSVCQAVWAPGSNVTWPAPTRAGPGAWNSGSMRTVKVNQSSFEHSL